MNKTQIYMTTEYLIEKLNSDYTRCSALNIPAVSSRLFYPIYESVIDETPTFCVIFALYYTFSNL